MTLSSLTQGFSAAKEKVMTTHVWPAISSLKEGYVTAKEKILEKSKDISISNVLYDNRFFCGYRVARFQNEKEIRDALKISIVNHSGDCSLDGVVGQVLESRSILCRPSNRIP